MRKAAFLLLVLSVGLIAVFGAEALVELRKRAEQGDAAAQNEIGVNYEIGNGVPQDSAEAVRWYQKAAEQGNATAQASLGWAYANGDGVSKDLVEAAKWYRKAAEQGFVAAQFSLGLRYESGIGVPKDLAEAVRWYRKAAEQGVAVAQYSLGGMYARGDGVPKDAAEAVRWYRKAAEQGNATAQNIIGWMYAQGDGVPKDSAEAVRWYRKAAEQGDLSAQNNLGVMYDHGNGVPKNAVEAARWYRKAAEQGDPSAQNNLGVAYAQGGGVLKDEFEALVWFNLAAMSGDVEHRQNQEFLERRLGQQVTLLAQQRSKEILVEIEKNKRSSRAGVAKKQDAAAIEAKPTKPKASGTGSIVTASGHILTAAHVVAGAKSVSVVTENGIKVATVLLIEEQNDLAVLKIDANGLNALPVASSRGVRLGQVVATIGFPNVSIQGFSPKLTKGEISSLNGVADDPRSWQISVPVQPGNSGGPLLDEQGNLIGVVESKLGLKAAAATKDLPQNVAYALKSAYALALLEPYLENGAPSPITKKINEKFEEMVARAQRSVVLVLAY